VAGKSFLAGGFGLLKQKATGGRGLNKQQTNNNNDNEQQQTTTTTTTTTTTITRTTMTTRNARSYSEKQ